MRQEVSFKELTKSEPHTPIFVDISVDIHTLVKSIFTNEGGKSGVTIFKKNGSWPNLIRCRCKLVSVTKKYKPKSTYYSSYTATVLRLKIHTVLFRDQHASLLESENTCICWTIVFQGK